MLPVNIDLARVRVVLIGNTDATLRRLHRLDEAGTGDIDVYAPDPVPELAVAAGARLRRRLPGQAEIARAQLVYIAGLDEPAASQVHYAAKQAGVLVNIEDDPARCDFHSAAVLRCGDLTIAVSTGGRAAGLAAAIRRELEEQFGPEWQARLDRLAGLRAEWQRQGADSRTIADRTAAWFAEQRGGQL